MVTRALFVALGLLLVPGGEASARTFERLVGATSPTGDAYLVKRFQVSRGWIIDGFAFYSNDMRTTFPSVMILRGRLSRLSDASLLLKLNDVRPVGSHRTVVTCPSIRVESDEDLYVAIQLPVSTGVRGVGEGAGLAARPLEGQVTSYFVSGRDGVLGEMDVDYAIDLILRFPGKQNSQELTQVPEVEFLTVGIQTAESNPIEFGVPSTAGVDLGIYDVTGRLIRELVKRSFAPGVYRWPWDGQDDRGRRSAAGVYFVKLTVGEKVLTDKLVLVR